ncbi:stemmadenine O-acetyltransferase-like [Diospyros lotus]|uniref:stemmadenine O-acetyltransferase-like n=1 Tax=Diospyros lotus TaxID=55363 RepID=UPI002253BD79|nr:stemmadenine O-acetyltransferase-like [Diospyros lotus]
MTVLTNGSGELEVTVVSREFVKPSTPTPADLKIFKISFLDQILPSAYVPVVFHYPIADGEDNIKDALARLKSSLSDTLSRFYHLAGRLKDHTSIHCNDDGILYVETQVNCHLSEYLKRRELEVLHRFIPFQDFVAEPENTLVQLAVQVNVFAAGGIAIGVSMSHKAIDASTLASFLKCWAALCSGCKEKAIFPDLAAGPALFPTRSEQLPRSMGYLKESWLKEGKSVLRRFVFDRPAIKALKAKAATELAPNPGSSQVVTGLIWKSAMAASKAVKGSQQASMLAFAVNMRTRTVPPVSEHATGNIFWLTMAYQEATQAQEEDGTALKAVVGRLAEAIKRVNVDFVRSLQGEEGVQQVLREMEERDGFQAREKPEVFMASSLTCFRFTELDFGWGKPVWVCHAWGYPGSVLVNGLFLAETAGGDGVEAWLHLDEAEMAVLEADPEFLSYASPNPGVLLPVDPPASK